MDIDHLKTLRFQETELQRMIREINPIQSIFAEQERIAQMINPHRAVLEEIERASQSINHSFVANGMDGQFSRMLKDFVEQSRSPTEEAIAELQKYLVQPSIAEAIGRYAMEADSVSRMISAMQTPSLDFQNQLRSITALTELHGIGHVLATMPSFDDNVASALRVDLGDWRRPVVLDYAALLDPVVRSELYISRGLDPNLTTFPASAFRDGLTLAGLYDESPQEDVDSREDDAEAAFMRTNEAHSRLMRFEYALREFIGKAMTAAVGEDWIKHRVSEPMRKNWMDKKKVGLAAGEADLPLIAYADFTDYLEIIVRKDNWREVFGAKFRHKPSVEESFRRLYPVRVCTMHARPITQDDALFLLVEIKRLSKVIGFGS